MKQLAIFVLFAWLLSSAEASLLRAERRVELTDTHKFLGALRGFQFPENVDITTDKARLSAERARMGDYALQVLAVQRVYELIWICGVGLLTLCTAAYFAVKGTSTDNEEDTEARRKAFQKKATGISTDDHEFAMTQTGFVQCLIGTPLYFLWACVPLLGYIQMTVFTLDHYLFALHVPDQTWLQLAEPFLVVFLISHVVLFFQAYVGTKVRVFFMRTASLMESSHVLMADPSNPDDPGTLVEVKYTESPDTDVEPMKYFEFTCVRYLWNKTANRFRPSGQDDVTCQEAKQRVIDGGLSGTDLSRRISWGPNTINIEVPSLFGSLANEFLSAIYIFQFSCIWVYMFYSTWNIASIWLVLALFSGSTKAFLVRKNQLKIKDMAATETEANIYRAGKWTKVSSAAIVPGDILCVTDGTVPCDIAILEGLKSEHSG